MMIRSLTNKLFVTSIIVCDLDGINKKSDIEIDSRKVGVFSGRFAGTKFSVFGLSEWGPVE